MSRVNKERFVVDEKGNKTGVVLSIDDYERILQELDELEAIRVFDAAKSSSGDAIPAEQAFAEIEKTRR